MEKELLAFLCRQQYARMHSEDAAEKDSIALPEINSASAAGEDEDSYTYLSSGFIR